ncbi:UNVERIFIED_CONTAM: hypothetical protein FKN15_001279 [Acipenser sinensis]
MKDRNSLINMDNLLLQLVYSSSIVERKAQVQHMRTKLNKLEEEVSHRQKLIKHYIDNRKSLKAAGALLNQYEKTLQAELQRCQADTEEDMKMYRDRVESYTEVLQQHQARYAQSPLGQQLLQRQSEREQIEQRIETYDDEIEQRERALQTLREDMIVCFKFWSSEAEDREGKKAVNEEVPRNEQKELDEEQLREEEK